MTTTVREKPIIFSGPMVKAILEGRKTKTRRVVKHQDELEFGGAGGKDGPEWNDPGEWGWRTADDDWIALSRDQMPDSCDSYARCPHGWPGDLLWVREAWAVSSAYDSYKPSELTPHVGTVAYRAGGGLLNGEPIERTCFDADGGRGKWRPSIFLPRWASRIDLEITGVRVERLQAITRLDCVREGWPHDNDPAHHAQQIALVESGMDDENIDDAAICWFADLWESINGAGSWERSPWVWVIEFRKTKP